MAVIQFDTQRAFQIPDERRIDFFALADKVAHYAPVAMNLSNVKKAWNTDLDPIVVIDSEYFSTKNWDAIIANLTKMGVKEVFV